MKKQLVSSVLVLNLVFTTIGISQASATSCKDADSAISNAQATYMGVVAAVSAARAAVASAQSRERAARLPAQRAVAAVEVIRAQSSVSKLSSALASAKIFLSSEKAARKNCTK